MLCEAVTRERATQVILPPWIHIAIAVTNQFVHELLVSEISCIAAFVPVWCCPGIAQYLVSPSHSSMTLCTIISPGSLHLLTHQQALEAHSCTEGSLNTI